MKANDTCKIKKNIFERCTYLEIAFKCRIRKTSH